ncbi:MAG: response regulator [Spirochaetales bacterium]|nr:response regulator [Spirochaetales bacterium]
MYNVLIVDDEKMIRDGIKAAMPWSNINISQVYTAVSAEKALEVIRSEEIHILLTDINMPGLSGLEMIDEIKKTDSDIDIIVFTGYDNFEYAQQALRMKVEDFFLKPVNEDTLAQSIFKLTKIRDNRLTEQKHQRLLRRKIGVEEQLKLEITMGKLIHGFASEREYQSFMGEYQYPTDTSMQVVVLIPVLYTNISDDDKSYRLLSIKNICLGMFDSKGTGITFIDKNDRIVLVLFQDKESEEILEKVEKLNSILVDEYKFHPKIVMGSLVTGFRNLNTSYNDAMFLIESKLPGETRILQERNSVKRLDLFNRILEEQKNTMVTNTANIPILMEAFDSFEEACEAYNLATGFVRKCCFEIASAIYFGYAVDSGHKTEKLLEHLLLSIADADRDEAFSFTRTFINDLINSREESSHELIEAAKQYIGSNLDKDLSVSIIAEEMFLSENYFSRLFKKVCGTGCNKYITEKRIEKAKALLETTNLQSGMIAALVGYRDCNYFSLAFKKHTGESPTSYRNGKRQI